MNSILKKITLFISVLFSLSGIAQNQSFEWYQAIMGGGGYIVGLIIHPENSDIVYARCDVGGIFKSVDGGKSWKSINNGYRNEEDPCVESFAINPHNPNVLLQCSGTPRMNKLFGVIHKTTDGGKSWKAVSRDVDYYGTGPHRMLGERIMFDPFDPQRVVTIGFMKGIFISDNGGDSFSYAGLAGEPGGSLVFHPTIKGLVYAGTMQDIPWGDKEYLYKDIYNRPKVGRLFRSEDSGKTWNKVFETPEFSFSDIVISKENPDVIVVSSLDKGGIFKSTDGGKSFHKSMDGLPIPSSYNTVSIDPSNPKRLYTAPDRRGGQTHIQLVPIYVSNDFGDTWQAVKFFNRSDFTQYPGYVRTEEWIGWAISKIKVDPKNDQRILMCNWYGVSISEDGGKTWCGNNFKGMETSCMEGVTVDPVKPGKVFLVLGDHQPNVSSDWGITWSPFIRPFINPPLTRSNAIAPSRYKPNFSVYSGGHQRNPTMLRTFDDGKTYEITKQFKKGLFVQGLREDPFSQGNFYAFLDGAVADSAGIWKSDDWGKTWKYLSNPFPEYIQMLPYQKDWIESEVLSVVYYQKKNVCGTNQLFCLDPFKPKTMMVGEWTEGLFISHDEGKTWDNISKGLPFKKSNVSILNAIVADESRQGTFYAGFIQEGLWKTDNYGKTWRKVFPLDKSSFNATSIVVGGFNKDEIFVACEPLIWSNVPSAIFFSKDSGKSWTDIYDPSLGALRWKGIALDKQNGTLYGVTCGNGAFYAKRKLDK